MSALESDFAKVISLWNISLPLVCAQIQASPSNRQQKKERLAREAKEAKEKDQVALTAKKATWAKNQEKKKALKPGEEAQLEGVGEEDIDPEREARRDMRAAAMGAGDALLFEKKISKEDKKAAAAAKRAEKVSKFDF
jgi:hypothetical protein